MKEILFITRFDNLTATINVNSELINQLSKNFKSIYFINSGNLAFPKNTKIDENIKKEMMKEFLFLETLFVFQKIVNYWKL